MKKNTKRKKLTSHLSPEMLKEAEKLYAEGKITKTEWSLMTPALRLHLKRNVKKHRKEKAYGTK